MRLRLIIMTCAIAFLPTAGNAQLMIEMGNIKCDQYLAMSPKESRDFSAWMSGWFSYKNGRTFVDLVLFQKNIASVKTWCRQYPQATVMAGLQAASDGK